MQKLGLKLVMNEEKLFIFYPDLTAQSHTNTPIYLQENLVERRCTYGRVVG